MYRWAVIPHEGCREARVVLATDVFADQGFVEFWRLFEEFDNSVKVLVQVSLLLQVLHSLPGLPVEHVNRLQKNLKIAPAAVRRYQTCLSCKLSEIINESLMISDTMSGQ